MSDKDVFINVSRTITVDDSVFLRVQTAAITGLIAVTAIGKAAGVPIVADGKDLTEVCTGDHSPDFESFTGGPASQAFCKLKVNFFE